MSSSSIQNFSYLSGLLPYDLSTKSNGNLRTALKEYRLLLIATEQTMGALQRGEIDRFDPVVGENACQIRTVKIAKIATRCLEEAESVLLDTVRVKQKVEDLSSSLPQLMKSGISLGELLQREGLDLSLSMDQLFLIESYLLSIVQVVKDPKSSIPLCINGVANSKKLKELESSISNSFAESLLRRARQLIATASVEFVREEALSLGDPQLIRMTSEEFTIRYNGWPCIPMLWTYKTLLLAAQNQNIPIILLAQHLSQDVESIHRLSRVSLI